MNYLMQDIFYILGEISLNIILKGAIISGSLIVAIGAQNVFVLRQGLLKQNVFWVSLTCFFCDIILMSIGVAGLGTIISSNKYATVFLAIAGALFLFWYGLKAFISSFKIKNTIDIQVEDGNKLTVRKAILATLAISLLNPHVYLDTVVVVGGVAGTLSVDDKIYFLIGALLSSFFWFFSLGFGAKFLSPLFRNPQTWKILDFVIGCVMWFISYGLFRYSYFLFKN